MAKRKSVKITKKNLPIFIIAAILAIIVAIFGKGGNPEDTAVSNTQNGQLLTAHFIDVGQGDCTLFVSGDDAMLIDCGEKEYSDSVINFLKTNGITQLDYVVVTHAHSDHMGGMADVLDAIPTENIIFSEPSEKSSGSKTYGDFLDAADRSGADIILAEPDYTFSLGSAECKILAPFSVSEEEENDNSVVMHITAGTTSFLMTGDAEKAVEKEIIANYPSLRATVLKVGHHGSKTSSSDKFISMLGSETAVIHVGEDNSYNHPTDTVLNTLNKYNIDTYRTDLEGTITINCFADTYTVSTER